MNWDNHGALRASLVKVRKDLESISNNLDQTMRNTKDEATDEPEMDDSQVEEIPDNYRDQMDSKLDEVFDQDQEYKEKMTISEEEMNDLHESMKSKVEDQKDVVDPIAILRIFNRAYNSFSITKDQYNALDGKYSPKIAARKKSYYEVLENTARHTKLFQEWNDGVLALLQQYGEYISKHTKKFIITMLDDNKLFGNKGAPSCFII